MSSSRKTDFLKLNQWLDSDKPARLDFVNDNALIDEAFRSHSTNSDLHCSSDEKNEWNNPFYMFSYVGDNASSRTVNSGCPFAVSWGIVFANNMPISVVDIANNSNYNYFAIFSKTGYSSGASITGGNNLKVYQSSTAIQKTEYRNLNEKDVVYNVIMFR